MSNATKRGEGAAEELGGKIERGVGKIVGSKQMVAKGNARVEAGQEKQDAAKAAERVKGSVEEAVGTVKNRVGAVLGNERMQAEGKVKELEGEARQKANR